MRDVESMVYQTRSYNEDYLRASYWSRGTEHSRAWRQRAAREKISEWRSGGGATVPILRFAALYL